MTVTPKPENRLSHVKPWLPSAMGINENQWEYHGDSHYLTVMGLLYHRSVDDKKFIEWLENG